MNNDIFCKTLISCIYVSICLCEMLFDSEGLQVVSSYALLTACRKPQLQTYGTRLLYLMHLTASSLLNLTASIDNMKAPIRPHQFMDTGYCTYWHLSSSDGASVPPIWGLTWWPCSVSTLVLLCVFFGLSKWHDEAPCTQPLQPPSQERFWESNSIGWGMFLPWVSQLVTLWLWTSSILTLATCFMYREASVLGLESWREKQRAPWCQCSIPVRPLRATTHRPNCHLFQRGRLKQCQTMATCDAKRGRQTQRWWKCLSVWHSPVWQFVEADISHANKSIQSCRWLLVAITGGASWVRALAGNLDVAMDG